MYYQIHFLLLVILSLISHSFAFISSLSRYVCWDLKSLFVHHVLLNLNAKICFKLKLLRSHVSVYFFQESYSFLYVFIDHFLSCHTWTLVKLGMFGPICFITALHCPTKIMNGFVDIKCSQEVNSECQYHCDDLFSPVNQRGNIKCLPSGQWNESDNLCLGK